MVNPWYLPGGMGNSGNTPVKAIENIEILRESVPLLPEEEAWFRSGKENPGLPLRITPHYLKLMKKDLSGALRRMAIPRVEEWTVLDYETPDPLHEEPYEVVHRCIHRYRDRVLVLLTDACALYCRYCFRRRFTGENRGVLGDEEIRAVKDYLESHPEVREVILSGGDPLMLPDRKLDSIIGILGNAGSVRSLRLSSRIPVVLPSRITAALAGILSSGPRVWQVIHINHPAEISPEFLAAVDLLAKRGIPMLSQSVLLKGVNDDPEILAKLFRGLVAAGVKPYYLFQGDLAPGTSHLRVPLSRGLSIFRELSSMVSGLALPAYAVDLPGGGGKVRLGAEAIAGLHDGEYHIRSIDGRIFRYPEEPV